MATPAPPVATAPKPPPPKPAPPAPSVGVTKKTFAVEPAQAPGGQIVVVYGPGGSGKTELCKLTKLVGLNPCFIDLENGAGFLKPEDEGVIPTVDRLSPIPQSFSDLRDALHEETLWSRFDTVIIDSLTKVQELAEAFVLGTVKAKGDRTVDSIGAYGFGDGLEHVYNKFLLILSDLDAIRRRGKHVICTAHECVSKVPNPNSEDFIRFEPRLQSPQGGKASIRHKVKEWCDHLLFVGYDVAVEDGKGKGAGTRTIYSTELPTHMAKTRLLTHPIPYTKGSPELWQKLFTRN